MREYIATNCPETAELSKNNKEGVFSYIYDYAMLNIYSEIFPQTPTEYDNDLCSRIENFKNVSPEEMNIKPENHHTELWELSIKSIFA